MLDPQGLAAGGPYVLLRISSAGVSPSFSWRQAPTCAARVVAIETPDRCGGKPMLSTTTRAAGCVSRSHDIHSSVTTSSRRFIEGGSVGAGLYTRHATRWLATAETRKTPSASTLGLQRPPSGFERPSPIASWGCGPFGLFQRDRAPPARREPAGLTVSAQVRGAPLELLNSRLISITS